MELKTQQSAAPFAATCPHCRTTFERERWSELNVVARVDKASARDVVDPWPWGPDDVLEVRHCACGNALVKRLRL